MTAFLVVVALIAAVIGLLSLSQATMGAGFVALGCLLAILARISQASEYRKQDIAYEESIRAAKAKTLV